MLSVGLYFRFSDSVCLVSDAALVYSRGILVCLVTVCFVLVYTGGCLCMLV